MSKQRGFTLIELMVVAAIIAILASIAIPSYLNQTRKSRRSGAEAAIQQIALREERYRADNPSYLSSSAATWAQLGGDPSGTYYTYAVVAVAGPPPTYTITATAAADQVNDKAQGQTCTPLTYAVGNTGLVTKGPNAACWGN